MALRVAENAPSDLIPLHAPDKSDIFFVFFKAIILQIDLPSLLFVKPKTQ